jgi:hypothetical protein
LLCTCCIVMCTVVCLVSWDVLCVVLAVMCFVLFACCKLCAPWMSTVQCDAYCGCSCSNVMRAVLSLLLSMGALYIAGCIVMHGAPFINVGCTVLCLLLCGVWSVLFWPCCIVEYVVAAMKCVLCRGPCCYVVWIVLSLLYYIAHYVHLLCSLRCTYVTVLCLLCCDCCDVV